MSDTKQAVRTSLDYYSLPDGGVTLSSCIMQNKFTLEAGGSGHAYASVFLKLREDIEFEVEVAEFDKASEPLLTSSLKKYSFYN